MPSVKSMSVRASKTKTLSHAVSWSFHHIQHSMISSDVSVLFTMSFQKNEHIAKEEEHMYTLDFRCFPWFFENVLGHDPVIKDST